MKMPAEISVHSGQYHFVTAEGWREEWITETPGEWWDRRLWIKAGGHKQEYQNMDKST